MDSVGDFDLVGEWVRYISVSFAVWMGNEGRKNVSETNFTCIRVRELVEKELELC